MLALALTLLLACKDPSDSGDPSADDSATPPDPNLDLFPGFVLATVDGVATAEQSASTCAGFFPAAPQHRMKLSTTFLGLRLETDTPDALLYVTFQASTFCSDIKDTAVQQIERGSWSAGSYDIYVGVRDADDEVAYVLSAIEG